MPRDEVIHNIATAVRERNPLHYADLKNPQYSIIVEIIRNMCCLAVVPDYFKYRRYNLLEICTVSKEENTSCNEETKEEVEPTDGKCTDVKQIDLADSNTAISQEETKSCETDKKQGKDCLSETDVNQEDVHQKESNQAAD